jgi:CRISPR associated protein Cas1
LPRDRFAADWLISQLCWKPTPQRLISELERHADQMAEHNPKADSGFLENNRTAHVSNPACGKPKCIASGQRDLELRLRCPAKPSANDAVAEGYDPTIGIMHEGRYGSSAFVFDLMEPERPWLIERYWNF